MTQALVAQGHVTSGGTGGWSPESRVRVRLGYTAVVQIRRGIVVYSLLALSDDVRGTVVEIVIFST